ILAPLLGAEKLPRPPKVPTVNGRVVVPDCLSGEVRSGRSTTVRCAAAVTAATAAARQYSGERYPERQQASPPHCGWSITARPSRSTPVLGHGHCSRGSRSEER